MTKSSPPASIQVCLLARTSEENDSDDNEEDNPLLSVPTHAQVLNSFRTFRTFGMLKDDEEMLYTLEKIEAKLLGRLGSSRSVEAFELICVYFFETFKKCLCFIK